MTIWYMCPENVCPICKKPPTLRVHCGQYFYACKRIGHRVGPICTTEPAASKAWRELLVNENSFKK
jgi:hypothetical protein